MKNEVEVEPYNYPTDKELITWAAEYCEEMGEPIYAKIIRKCELELNEARECLKEAMDMCLASCIDQDAGVKSDWYSRWNKAAGPETANEP